ncbi:ALH_1b_G0047860.mRNA.1.CDS.1 [Saccharomyces cerevisiae]|nr:ALH_1b_G0047860.mRNA.1.CDS.1 [Saccharomyces cerevisiae]CAI6872101.1 ALH_1b_G0047860.mRNA.1.CDS.1 [Saccharomyces cerevisiae]
MLAVVVISAGVGTLGGSRTSPDVDAGSGSSTSPDVGAGSGSSISAGQLVLALVVAIPHWYWHFW